MNPLTKVLRTLRHTSTAWSIIIHPDPHTCPGLQPIGRPDIRYFGLNLCSGIYLERYLYDFPMYAGASNITSYVPPKPMQSKWVKLTDTHSKNEKGEALPDVLIKILEKFPEYDLETKEGSEVAIRDIESRLVEVASFEEFDKKKR